MVKPVTFVRVNNAAGRWADKPVVVRGKMREFECVTIDPAEHLCAEAPQDSGGASDTANPSVLH